MRVKTTVVCLPVTDLQRSLGFYRAFLERDDAKADGDTIVLELPNLSLFLMQRDGFEAYSRKAGRTALLPGADAPAIVSCAVETREDVDRALERAQGHGGSRARPGLGRLHRIRDRSGRTPVGNRLSAPGMTAAPARGGAARASTERRAWTR